MGSATHRSPPDTVQGAVVANGWEAAAAPVLDFADQLRHLQRADPLDLARRATILIDRFSADVARTGERAQAIRPARLALGFIIDQAARANRRIDATAWGAAARRELYEGQDMSLARLRDFMHRAEAAGPEYGPVARFLAACLARAEGARRREGLQKDGWGASAAVLVLGFAGLVVAWAAQVEWRFHRDLSGVFAEELLASGLDREGVLPDLPARLDRVADAHDRVARAAAKAPLGLFAGPLGFSATQDAGRAYAAALDRHLPVLLARAIDTALATEGGGLEAYDTLRAWSILSGQSDWNPAWLSAWAQARPTLPEALPALAPHIARMARPTAIPPAPDGDLLRQAAAFAAEAPEADRAWLELARSGAVAAIPAWRPETAVPALHEIFERRSGAPIDHGPPGLYTRAGWDHARDAGAGLAVQAARAEAARIFGREPPRQNDAPDRVLERLQAETLAIWKAYLADLRVRSFTDRGTALVVSGRLSGRSSPVEALLRAAWAEAGGGDRLRPHALQLRVATRFGPAIQYLDQGRIADISALFAALNVALAAGSGQGEDRPDRLMGVTERARSIATLGQAPPIVVQIVEDVLAQTAQAEAGQLSNPLTQRWQTEVLALCNEVVAGRYPFAPGADADLAAAARLFAPAGALDRFYRGAAQSHVDTSDTPWRWKPEARFAGLTQDSAAMLQRGLAIGEGLFAGGRADAPFALAALAERGRAFVSLGGTGSPVEAAGEPARLSWPGPAPQSGVEASFTTPAGEQVRLGEPGPWGLLRVLDGLRVRTRDEGQRFLVDLRVEGARLFMEMTFDRPANPVALRPLMEGFACPTTL
jgi:type VI protein secretion system component VasK